jgi:hypothetical protein
MTVQLERNLLSRALRRRIELHREYLARLRAEGGDPDAALADFLRKTFSEEALAETYAEYVREGHSGLGQDANDSTDG